MIYREVLTRYRIVASNPPVFFLVYAGFSCIACPFLFISPEIKRSYFTCIRYVLGQTYSEDRVFARVLRLVFAWITLPFCVRHD